MNTPFERLMRALAEAVSDPPAGPADFEGLPDVGDLPSPWETWLLVGLVRHRARQLWVGEIVRTRLGGDLGTIARLGALGHPDAVPGRGTVPGLPEWECYFHGIGCCVTHKVRGDRIDVNFHGDSAEYFDEWFYIWYLKSLREPEPAERRLLELYPSFEPVRLGIADLLAAGALNLRTGGETHRPRVTDEVLAHEEAVAAFCEAWADPGKRLWFAAVIGDWPAAHAAAVAAGSPLADLAAERAEQCRELRRRRLLEALGEEPHAPDALLALADLGATDLPSVLESALRGPISGLTLKALDVIERADDPAWCPRVYNLWKKLAPGGPIPDPYLWIHTLKFLLRHGYRSKELLAALPAVSGSVIGEACLLALEHAPEHALPLFRRALIDRVPGNRSTAAAILALIDRPWSRRVLLDALAASDDQEKTADARAALLELSDEEAHRAVAAWEERNPHEDEPGRYLEIEGRTVGPFYSMGEIMLKDRGRWIRYEMENLHDRVMKVRDRVPPEPPSPRAPWWRFWRK